MDIQIGSFNVNRTLQFNGRSGMVLYTFARITIILNCTRVRTTGNDVCLAQLKQ